MTHAEVSSLRRGLDVLFALEDCGGTAGQIADRIGRDRSQVSRVLRTLADTPFVERDAGSREYRLGWRLDVLAQRVDATRLFRVGREVAHDLTQRTGEVAGLTVLRGDSTVAIVESVPADALHLTSWVGRAFPAYCSDSGQALLFDATLDVLRTIFARTQWTRYSPATPSSVEDLYERLIAARRRGYAVIEEEGAPGHMALCAPVRSFRGDVVAGLFVAGPMAHRSLNEAREQVGHAVVAAATDLSRALGWEPSVP